MLMRLIIILSTSSTYWTRWVFTYMFVRAHFRLRPKCSFIFKCSDALKRVCGLDVKCYYNRQGRSTFVFKCFRLQKALPVPGSLSVWTIEKASGRRAGSGREIGGALSFSWPNPARSWSRLSPARFFDRPYWPGACNRLLQTLKAAVKRNKDIHNSLLRRLKIVISPWEAWALKRTLA